MRLLDEKAGNDNEDVLRNFLYYAGFRSSEHIPENILRHMVLLHAPVFYAKVCLRMSLNGRRTLLEDCDFNVLENGIPEVWDHIMKDSNRKNERGEIQVYPKSILKAIATSPRQDRNPLNNGLIFHSRISYYSNGRWKLG